MIASDDAQSHRLPAAKYAIAPPGEDTGFTYEPASGELSPETLVEPTVEREFALLPLWRRLQRTLGARNVTAEIPEYIYEERAEQPAEIPAPATFSNSEFASDEPAVAEALPSPAMQTVERLTIHAPEAVVAEPVQEPVVVDSVAPVVKTEIAPAQPVVSVAEMREETPELVPVAAPELPAVAEPVAILARMDGPALAQNAVALNDAPVAKVEATEPLASEQPAAPAVPEELQPEFRPVLLPRVDASARTSVRVESSEEVRPEVPALQREFAWRDPARTPLPAPVTVSEQPAPRPRLVVPPPAAPKPRRMPDWKTPDWKNLAGSFTPKRAAAIGASLMAAAIILGVSLAQRPASSLLPQHPQTAAVQPGGVTLSTHPAVTQQALTQPQREVVPVAQLPRPTPAPARHVARRQPEPEVVTHYYHSKPSPVHTASSGGVRHYSDLQ
jgi:hypothetical protein